MAKIKAELIRHEEIHNKLSDTERYQLLQCEDDIRKGLHTFFKVGRALGIIRDNRLYRETHSDFKKYCKEKWDLGQSHAYRQIEASKTISLLEAKVPQLGNFVNVVKFEPPENIEFSGNDYERSLTFQKETDQANPQDSDIPLPRNEAQVRPLTRLKPNDRVKAWALVLEQVQEGKKLTSGLVKKAVREIKGESAARSIDTARQAIDHVDLLSEAFMTEYKVLLSVIEAEWHNNWLTSSPKEIIYALKSMIKTIEEMLEL